MTETAIVFPSTSSGQRRGGDRVELTPELSVHSVPLTFHREAEIFAPEDPVEHFYKVISGAVRITRLLEDGRRHIIAFHLAGDIFGLEPGDRRQYAAEAVTDCQIARVRRDAIALEARSCESAAAIVWRVMAAELQRAQDHALMLGRLNAEERVRTFLADLAVREGGRGVVDLPMSRIDMADYLGLTIETVSRTLSHLERTGVIAFAGLRRIILKSPHAALSAAA